MWDVNHISWELARLVLAAMVGAAIGFEREAHGQAAGLRTRPRGSGPSSWSRWAPAS
jgi:hypothetical protein